MVIVVINRQKTGFRKIGLDREEKAGKCRSVKTWDEEDSSLDLKFKKLTTTSTNEWVKGRGENEKNNQKEIIRTRKRSFSNFTLTLKCSTYILSFRDLQILSIFDFLQLYFNIFLQILRQKQKHEKSMGMKGEKLLVQEIHGFSHSSVSAAADCLKKKWRYMIGWCLNVCS